MEENCCICIEAINPTDIKVLSCKHKFHASCIDEWLNIKQQCPLCRRYETVDTSISSGTINVSSLGTINVNVNASSIHSFGNINMYASSGTINVSALSGTINVNINNNALSGTINVNSSFGTVNASASFGDSSILAFPVRTFQSDPSIGVYTSRSSLPLSLTVNGSPITFSFTR
jgi:hypothetical protein